MLPRRQEAGFTLIELAIAIGMSSLVAALIFSVFTAQNRVYRQQEDLGRTQNNLRLAMEIVTRDVALAGHGMGMDGTARGAGGQTSDNDPIYALEVIDSFAGGTADAVVVTYLNPNPQAWAVTDENFTYECGTDNLRFSPPASVSLFESGDRIACFDPGGAAFGPRTFTWQVDSVNAAAGAVSFAASTENDFVDICPSTANLPRELICSSLEQIAYYIDDSDGDGTPGTSEVPMLMRGSGDNWPSAADVPVALGIEDLQIELCRGNVDCKTDTSLAVAGWDPSVQTWTDLGTVRVAMGARSRRRNLERSVVSAPLDLSAADGPSGFATADAFHRRYASRDVLLRNARASYMVANSY